MAPRGSTIQRSRTGQFENAREYYLPYQDALQGLILHQGNEEKVLRNLAPANVGSKLLKIGAPDFQGTEMRTLTAVDGIDTLLSETDTFTWIKVMRSTSTQADAANQTMAMGNFNGSSGASIFCINHSVDGPPAARIRGNAYSTANNLPTVNVIDITQRKMIVFRCSPTLMQIDDLSAGFNGNVVPVGARVLAPSRTIRDGRSYSGAFQGNCYSSATIVAYSWWPDSALAKTKAFLQYELSFSGLTFL